MLLIPTYLGPSRIHGIGVYASEPIPAGKRIWEFTPGIDWKLTAEELGAFPEPYRSQIRAWSYLGDDGLYVLCGDNARFMNHQDGPNCDDPEGRYTVTNRDIAPGEELTCDYQSFDRESKINGLGFHGVADTVAATSSNSSS